MNFTILFNFLNVALINTRLYLPDVFLRKHDYAIAFIEYAVHRTGRHKYRLSRINRHNDRELKLGINKENGEMRKITSYDSLSGVKLKVIGQSV